MAIKTQSDFESVDHGLRKTLTLQQLFFLSMGGIIGSGWLFAVLAANAIAGPAVLLSWLIGGVLVLLIALTYAELGGMLPRSGAIVRYPHLTHGGYTGFLLGWAYLLSAVTVPAIEAEAVITYATKYISGLTKVSSGVTVLTGKGIGLALVLMVLFFFVNYFGIRLLGAWNQVFTWWKFIIPTLTFILLFTAFHGSNFSSYGGFAPMGFKPVFLAIATSGIVFAFLGFRQALDYGGEARNPQHDVPMATLLSVGAAVVLYVLLQLAFTGALNWHSAGVKAGDWAGLSSGAWASAPFYDAMKATGIGLLGAFASVLLIDSFISPSGTGWVYMGTSARTLYGMSVHGYLPKSVQSLHDRHRIPWVALIASLVVGCLFLAPFPSWYKLVGFISSATVLTYVMGGIGLQVLRRTAPGVHRPFRLQRAGVLAPISFLAASMIVYWSGFSTLVYVVAAVFVGLPLYTVFYAPRRGWMNATAGWVLGIVFLVAWIVTQYEGEMGHHASWGFPLYFGLVLAEVLLFTAIAWALSGPDGKRSVVSGLWFLFLVMGLFLLSYYGGYGPLTKPPLAFPVDNLVALVIGLVSFYWGVASGFRTEEIQAITEGEAAAAPPAEV